MFFVRFVTEDANDPGRRLLLWLLALNTPPSEFRLYADTELAVSAPTITAPPLPLIVSFMMA